MHLLELLLAWPAEVFWGVAVGFAEALKFLELKVERLCREQIFNLVLSLSDALLDAADLVLQSSVCF